jgi:hypothetical protein
VKLDDSVEFSAANTFCRHNDLVRKFAIDCRSGWLAAGAGHSAVPSAHAFSGSSMNLDHKIPAKPAIAITQVRAMSAGNHLCNATPITAAAAIEAIQ